MKFRGSIRSLNTPLREPSQPNKPSWTARAAGSPRALFSEIIDARLAPNRIAFGSWAAFRFWIHPGSFSTSSQTDIQPSSWTIQSIQDQPPAPTGFRPDTSDRGCVGPFPRASLESVAAANRVSSDFGPQPHLATFINTVWTAGFSDSASRENQRRPKAQPAQLRPFLA